MIIQIPSNCPCCNFTLQLVNDQLFCRNLACDAQVSKKIEHFCKTLQIKGMGPKAVEKLQLADLTEIFYLDLDYCAEKLGSRVVATKLLDEIDRSKTADLSVVLESFSIPLIGGTASKKIAAVVSHISEINAETCQKAGLGNKATENLLEWLNTDFQELKEFLPFSFSSNNKSSNQVMPTICITGKLANYKNKSEAYALLQAAGFQVVESVTKTLDYLVDETSTISSKRKKAEEYGISIITNLPQFLKEI